MPAREREIVNEHGRVVIDVPCQPMKALLDLNKGRAIVESKLALIRRYVLPGLDANLCRCDRCRQLDRRGIWWVDQSMRTGIAEDKKARRKQAAKL